LGIIFQIYFHGTDRKSFHEHVDPANLPPCYGGTLDKDPIHAMEWFKMLSKLEKEYESEYKISRYLY
jgi:hypothetical protein